jgi:uncharacterized membrane protein
MSQNYWTIVGAAAIGLLLVFTGLALAVLSNPANFSSSVENDKYIDLFAAGGFVCTIVGAGVFVTAASRTTTSMPQRHRTNANLGIGLGLVLQLAGLFLPRPLQLHELAGLVIVFASLPLIIWGAMHYAAGKGQSKWFGFVGILGLAGLVGLMLLPNRLEEAIQDAE